MAMKIVVFVGNIVGVFGYNAILDMRHVNARSARMHRGRGVYQFLASSQ